MMKDILISVYDVLKKDKDIESIVGDNIYASYLPQYNKSPAIVYSLVSSTYDSELGVDTDFVRTIVQISCHETTFKKARVLSRKVKKLFQNLSREVAGINIQATFIKSDFILGGGEVGKFDADEYIHILEFEFFHNEPKEGK